MTANGWFQIGLYLFVIFLVTKPLGVFMTRVFNREKTFLDPIFRPLERLVYRLTGVDETREMRWTEYAVAMLLFRDRKSTRLNSSHSQISYAVFCLKKKRSQYGWRKVAVEALRPG